MFKWLLCYGKTFVLPTARSCCSLAILDRISTRDLLIGYGTQCLGPLGTIKKDESDNTTP